MFHARKMLSHPINRLGYFSLICNMHTSLSFDIFRRTQVFCEPSSFKIRHSDQLLFIGSCFSENISSKLSQSKFIVQTNPFGIIYNPSSIKNTLFHIIEKKWYDERDLHVDHQENNLFHSWDHHSQFSGYGLTEVLSNINNKISLTNEYFQKCHTLFITLGTTHVHYLKSNNLSTKRIVANCHKQPPSLFEKRRLSLTECVQYLSEVVEMCQEFNSNIKIVFTVSPVRHTREGMTMNSLSKSALICAVHEIVQKYPKCTQYFPAYELVMDDLRDYRWFADDLIHPSSMAQEYVYQHFCSTYFTPETLAVCEEIEQLNRDLRHRPFLDKSPMYVKHLHRCLQAIKNIQTKYGDTYIDFSSELTYINNVLENDHNTSTSNSSG